ncbi:MAG TPA: RlmE family RNA methyltransferase [Polyangiaceae bacterium]|nr:RlmE family RNA methyltransferase [Polyangiaceae bacterium]
MSRSNPYSKADHRTLAARAQGYPARSVFKLEEIDQRCQLLKPGQHVVDLGAAPGSWSLYASKRIGEQGRLLSVDLSAITQGFAPNVHVLQADALALDSALHEQFGPYDVVLSDMAPRTTGDKFTNAARSQELFLAALAVAREHGKSGSHFVGKIFMGGDFPAAKAEVSALFSSVRVIKPKGTRDNSVEVFLVGLGRKPR